MGQVVSCNCLAQTLGMEDKEKAERLDMLKKGQKFMRSAFLGMTSREVFVTLTGKWSDVCFIFRFLLAWHYISEDSSTIQWKAAKTNFLSEEKGEVDLTSIKTVKMNGASGLQFIGDKFTGDSSKSQLDISSEDPKIRDQWVIALNEVIQGMYFRLIRIESYHHWSCMRLTSIYVLLPVGHLSRVDR